MAWTLEEEQETAKGKKCSIMRTWAKTIEEKKMKILFERKRRIFCVVFGFQEAAFPTRQNPRRAVERIQRKWWLFSPLTYETVPKKFASETIRNAERN